MPAQCSVDDLTAAINPIIQGTSSIFFLVFYHNPISLIPTPCHLALNTRCFKSNQNSTKYTALADATNTSLPEIDLSNVQGQCGDYKFAATAGTYIMTALTIFLALLLIGGTFLDYQRLSQQQDEDDGHSKAPMVHDGYSRLDQDDDGMDNGKGGGRRSEAKDALLDNDVEQARFQEARAEGERNGNGHANKVMNGSGVSSSSFGGSRQQKPQAALWRRILGCFSLYKNIPSLLGPARPGDFNSLGKCHIHIR